MGRNGGKKKKERDEISCLLQVLSKLMNPSHWGGPRLKNRIRPPLGIRSTTTERHPMYFKYQEPQGGWAKQRLVLKAKDGLGERKQKF